MDRYPFAVARKVYCCWGHDLAERNERFLSGIDADYFVYAAELHLGQLDGENKQRAAIALRANYHHALETLFSFLGALAQAPECVPAWLPKCKTPDLREIVLGMKTNAPLLTQCGSQRVSFRELALVVHQYCWNDEGAPSPTALRFGEFWLLLAKEFLDHRQSAEYNSLKHGFRVGAGGFVLRFGRQESPGIRPPEHAMATVGASDFGSTFLEPESIHDVETLKHHFALRRASLNWTVDSMVLRTMLIAYSIANVVGCIRCLNGAPPGTVRFSRPEDPSAFQQAWLSNIGVTSSNLDFVVSSEHVAVTERAEILHELELRTTEQRSNER